MVTWGRTALVALAASVMLGSCLKTKPDQMGGLEGGGSGRSGNSGRGGSAGFGGVACFEAGMRVATPLGSVPIETLRVGDEVLAFDERTGAVVAQPVTAVFVHAVLESGRLELGDGRSLRVTAEHPIYVAERGEYVEAREIAGPASIVTLLETRGLDESSGNGAARTPLLVGLARTSAVGFAARNAEKPVLVYNISVLGLENYFVEGVLVHNKSLGGTAGTGLTGGTGGICEPTAEHWPYGTCPGPTTCLTPSSEYVTLNQAVGSGGGAGPGAGGEGGAPGAGAPAGGVGGDGPEGAQITTVTLCSLPVAPEEERYLAVDFLMPPTSTEFNAYGIYDSGPCAGEQIGYAWIGADSAPEVGTWTTQCVRLPAGSFSSAMLSLVVTSPSAKIDNVRLVAGCECARKVERVTICGLVAADPGSGACVGPGVDGGI